MKFSALVLTAIMQQAFTAALPTASDESLEVRGSVEKRGGWFSSCTGAHFPPGTTILAANCYRADGSINFTELELNNCIADRNGNLAFPGSGFSFHCSGVYLSGSTVFGSCDNFVGGTIGTSIDTNGYVSNQNGNLAC